MNLAIAEAVDAGANDVPIQMEFGLTNGDTLRATRHDPFGFWHLSLKSGGKIGHPFDGAYTSRSTVGQAVQAYLNDRRLEIGECNRPPAPQVKPGYNADGSKKEK